MRSSNLEVALQSFIVKSVSRFTGDHFHFWKEMFTNTRAFEKATHSPRVVTKHWRLISKSKCTYQTRITLQIYHFHWKFSWNAFNINVKWHLKWGHCGIVHHIALFDRSCISHCRSLLSNAVILSTISCIRSISYQFCC